MRKTAAKKGAGARTIDEYLARLPPDQRAALTKVRKTIRAAAPDAVESISYGVPTYKLGGKPLLYFGAGKAHCSIYAVDVDMPELERFDRSKGTVRFTPDDPVPASVVTKIVKRRMKAVAGR
ncbi:MAG TPA: DUF1801 domain-containing protein [Candidatus Limnocylindria bacterium]|nr:DUF1801 domain-containing protein [Candidatus Limnocylindria bacterium]